MARLQSFIKVSCLFLILTVSPALGQENLPVLIKKVEPSIAVIFTYNREGKILGQGTGFFINKEGDVITNYHVLFGASRATIKTTDGKEYPIKRILAEDKMGDLIRVSIDIPKGTASFLPVLTTLPEVGEKVIVIGTPLGLDKTVSDGIVSAVREIPEFGKIIQVTAPISAGSSGSPVINMRGEVVGIATFFIVAGQNLNFAIPGQRIARMAIHQGETLSAREEGRMKDWLASAEGVYTSGLRYLLAEEYEKALPYFLETVRRNPKHGKAYFQIGYCRAKLGQYPGAIEPYKQAILLSPDDADIYNNLCVALGMAGRYDEAIQSCEQAIGLKPDLAEAYNNLGWTYQKSGRYQESILSCKEAIRLKPDFAMAHYNLGNNYFALKKYEDAIDSYKEAIRIKFDYAEGHLNLGAAYFHKGRFEEAIVSYKEAVKLKPSLAEAHVNLGMSYLRVGDRGLAIEEYKILKDLNRDLANQLFNLIYE
ncbi:MAG TPA: tetratricopeptide repeat protein [Thermodesulfobacteriota bacterium]|nr:tetratricopeptide repeat protein [Thermodesulfobacteriota bacterium]